MVSMAQIEAYGRAIGREFHPQRVVLFGSHAYGTPHEDSDVDLLVVMPFRGKPPSMASKIRMRLRSPFPMDLPVRTPEKVRERLEMGDPFMRDILRDGKVLYEARHG